MGASANEQNLANLEIYEDENANPEEDRSHFLAILVECLAKLNEVMAVHLLPTTCMGCIGCIGSISSAYCQTSMHKHNM